MAKSPSKAGRSSQGGELTVYTALLIVSSFVLMVGIGALWTANISQKEALGQNDGMPFTPVR